MHPRCPQWLNSAVFYQIFPPSFYDSNDDGIGDLEGIRQKLDYIASLGVNALWINPCFDSPFRDAGYDVRDFYRIAPRYGTNEDMKRLIRDAEKLGIRICLDLVAPHTSIDHAWFIESGKPDPNPFTNWYIWSSNMFNRPRGLKGEPFECVRGYAERPGAFATNFFWSQPKLNFGFTEPDPRYPEQLPVSHPDIQALYKEMKNVVRFWLDMGCSGYRCDSAKSVCTGPADDPDTCAPFWCEVNDMLSREYPDAVLMCEWGWPVDSVHAGFPVNLLLHNMKAYNTLFTGKGLPHSVGTPYFDIDGGDISAFLEAFMYHYGPVRDAGGMIGLPTGNHDCARISTGRSSEMMKCIFTFLMTMPGVPFVYYGEEIGMRNLRVRSVEGGYGRTGARSPMQWNSEPNAGFSRCSPQDLYIPIDSDPNRPTVAAQENDTDSQLNGLRELARIRRCNLALHPDATFDVCSASKETPFVFRRSKQGESVLVAINPRLQAARVTLDIAADLNSLKVLNKTGISIHDTNGQLSITLAPVSAAILSVPGLSSPAATTIGAAGSLETTVQ